jgi:hypothetical protein
MIILSLVPLGMLVSFLTGLFGIIFPLLGRLIAIPSFIVLNVFYLLIDFFGQLPFASVQFKIDQPIWILILYLLLIDLIVLFKKRSDRLPTV